MLPAVDPLLTRLHQLDKVLVQDISVAVTETFSFISYLKGERVEEGGKGGMGGMRRERGGEKGPGRSRKGEECGRRSGE